MKLKNKKKLNYSKSNNIVNSPSPAKKNKAFNYFNRYDSHNLSNKIIKNDSSYNIFQNFFKCKIKKGVDNQKKINNLSRNTYYSNTKKSRSKISHNNISKTPHNKVINNTLNQEETYKIIKYVENNNTNKFFLNWSPLFNLESYDKSGWTCMHHAIWNNNIDLFKLFMYNNANPDINSKENVTPLMLCCIKGFKNIAKYLLSLNNKGKDYKINISSKDIRGNTALHYVCANEHIDLMELLLKQPEIDYKILNNEYYSPFDVLSYKHKETWDKIILKIKQKQKELKFEEKSFDLKNKSLTDIYSSNNINNNNCNKNLFSKHFKIVNIIGKSDYCETYLVTHLKNNNNYTVKIMDKSKLINNNLLKLYLKDIEISKRINGTPGFINIYMTFQNDIKLFVVYEYFKYSELSSYITISKSFPEAKIKSYVSEIICLLEILQKYSIYNVNLSPNKLYINDKGQLVLSDFKYFTSDFDCDININKLFYKELLLQSS